jgi:membrane-associated phospholipid phosphatase
MLGRVLARVLGRQRRIVRWSIAAPSLVVALGLVGAPRAASADEVHELRHDVTTDATVAVTATILVVGSELAKADLAPATCLWCEDDALDRSTRDALRWQRPAAANAVSNVIGFAVAPLDAFGTLALAGVDAGSGAGSAGSAGAAAGRRVPVDALLLYESVAVSAVVNQLVKLTVGRERPFVHALGPDDKRATSQPSDNNLSFYSGHTGLTMTLAAAGGTIATLRGYRLAPLVWSSGAAISAFTGYLRIAADKHWLTDVLFGAAVGAAVGVLLPVLFHGRRDDVAVAPAGGALSSASAGLATPGLGMPALGTPSMATVGGTF